MKFMLLFAFFCGSTLSRPQQVSVADVFGATANRYGGSNSGIQDTSIIDDVFGPSNAGGYDSSGNPLPSTVDGTQAEYGSTQAVVNEVVDASSDECSYYAADGYSCVPYYNCEAGEIVTDGGGLIDIRSNFGILDPSTSKCPGYLEVCCKHPDATTTTTTEKVVIKTTAPPPPPYISQCGRRNTGGIGVRIKNDKYKGATQFGEWPHMCAILEKKVISYDEEINLYTCGGSLVAPGILLTAAHCVQKLKAENMKVRCGEWDTQQEIEPKRHEDRNVRKVIMDPLFDPRNLQNDFALLFLSENYVLQPHIDTICLPDSLKGIYSYNQKNCVATGWGKDQFGKKGEYQVIMKQVEMDIVDNSVCQNRLRTTRLGEFFKLDDSFICAGGQKDKDTCKGDGGGPLVCPAGSDNYGNPTHYVQAGIVAWGIECGKDGIPGVYASVADGLCFMSWAAQCGTGYPDALKIKGCEGYADSLLYELKSNFTTASAQNNKRLARKLDFAIGNLQKMRSECLPISGDYTNPGQVQIQEPVLVDGYVDPSQVQIQEPVLIDGYVDPSQAQIQEPVLVDGYVDPSQVQIQEPVLADGYVDPSQVQIQEPVLVDGYVDPSQVQIQEPVLVDGYVDPSQVQIQEPVLVDGYVDPSQVQIQEPVSADGYVDPSQVQIQEPVIIEQYPSQNQGSSYK